MNQTIENRSESLNSDLSDSLSELAAGRQAPCSMPEQVTEPPGIESPIPPNGAKRLTPSGETDGFKAMVMIAMVILGMLLLVPAAWSVLTLSDIWHSDRPDARTMAIAMLASWPLCLCLFAGASWLWIQARKSRHRSPNPRGR